MTRFQKVDFLAVYKICIFKLKIKKYKSFCKYARQNKKGICWRPKDQCFIAILVKVFDIYMIISDFRIQGVIQTSAVAAFSKMVGQ